MVSDLKISKVIPAEKSQVFSYMTRRELVEQWSAPEGMTLNIPQFEAKAGGKYRYEHSSKEGVFICEGFFKEIVPNEKIVSVETGMGPDGKVMFMGLECITTLKTVPGGTEFTVIQRGFSNEEMRQNCDQGWTQCLNKLSNLLNSSTGYRPSSESVREQFL
ncbi:MAG TPA: SRPBCC domain-containing protein [Bacteriovoracaceae bacterium]|nr:SRPBCC domain-containing protein [Bacteriovoracaceae bacterium]